MSISPVGFDRAEFVATPIDNSKDGVRELLALNQHYRSHAWPAEFRATTHTLRCADARNLSWIPSESVHLIVTSPPYWTLKEYLPHVAQLGALEDYKQFLDQLDKVWRECYRVLVPGGRICCVVGDICLPRKRTGKHEVVPLHADILVRCREIGLDALTPILWFKIANGKREVERGGTSGFYGKPYQPGGIVKNDFEYILFLRKGGAYRSASVVQKALSMLTKDEMQNWLRTAWTDIRGESTRNGHPAPYPAHLAERLVRLFSFAGDTVLDPFAGTGTSLVAALLTGRNSVGVEIERQYVNLALQRLDEAKLLQPPTQHFNPLIVAE
jgi:site-specific DNA-methyltransferase (adenine-specific)